MAARSLPMNGPVPDPLMATPSFLIAWLFDRFFDDYVKSMAGLDLSPAEHVVLLTVAELQPIKQARLAERVRVDHATFVGVVNALERRELLSRERDPTDRRALLVSITAAGRHLVGQAQDTVKSLEASSYAVLDAGELRSLTELLARIVRAVGEPS